MTPLSTKTAKNITDCMQNKKQKKGNQTESSSAVGTRGALDIFLKL